MSKRPANRKVNPHHKTITYGAVDIETLRSAARPVTDPRPEDEKAVRIKNAQDTYSLTRPHAISAVECPWIEPWLSRMKSAGNPDAYISEMTFDRNRGVRRMHLTIGSKSDVSDTARVMATRPGDFYVLKEPRGDGLKNVLRHMQPPASPERDNASLKRAPSEETCDR
jgi:hypothetical protein